MASARVKVEPPAQLPSSGITPIQYKQWKVALKIFLQQSPELREFYPGGLYETWESQERNNHRIKQLNANDKAPEKVPNAEHLAQRRLNLETFLGIIARYSDEGDFDDIMEKSTSLEWIHALHERRYGIQKKGRYFNKIHDIRFDKSTMSDYHKFYTELRSCFKSNLRKRGDLIKHSDTRLNEDEKMGPTTECLIVYMALERIDSRLPNEIDRVFGHLMNDNTTLIDLQTEIFSYIPRAMATLDNSEHDCNACNVSYSPTEQPNVSAIYNRSSNPQQRKFKQQKNQRQNNNYHPRTQYCKLCKALDMPMNVYNSHASENCRKKALLQELQVVDSEYYKNNEQDSECDEKYDPRQMKHYQDDED